MIPQSFIQVADDHFVACYEKRSEDVKDAWFMSEMRHLVPVVNEPAVAAFCARIAHLDPWRRDAEMKLMLESVKDGIASRSSDYAPSPSYGVDTSWRTEARDRLNDAYVYGQMFDDIVEQEDRNRAEDAARRAKCAEQARSLLN